MRTGVTGGAGQRGRLEIAPLNEMGLERDTADLAWTRGKAAGAAVAARAAA